MCGISGIVSFERSEYNLLALTKNMSHAIRHRGPDDEGFVMFDGNESINIGTFDTPSNVWNSTFPYSPQHQLSSLEYKYTPIILGHRRLSIIDLSPAGHQPMCDRSSRYWIVFNGAIYNYEELKVELIKLGYTFYSNTDTEVLLYSYIAWGKECVEKFIGMWSFVIYDKVEQKIFASRDRIGVKPFYYVCNQKHFAFASEIKALVSLPFFQRQLNDKAIFDYLALGKCELEEEGFFKNIFELPPAHSFELNINTKKLNKWIYYNPGYNDSWESFDLQKNEQLVSGFQDLLQDSIRLHLRTDAAVGACLSGGLDSSIITGLISNEKKDLPVFTVTSKGDKEDESDWAKKVVDKFNLQWHTTNPQPSDLLDNFEKFMYCQDMPCISANSYTHFQLMKLVNQSGVKVTIDGQGADELFGGYEQYYSSFLMDALGHGSFRTFLNAMKEPENDFARKKASLLFPFKIAASKLAGEYLTSKLYRDKNPEFSFIKKDFWNEYSDRILLLQNKISGSLNKTLYKDFHGSSLKTMLRVGDRNSMNFGIETRVPFSDDYRLEEFAFNLSAVYKVRNNYSKAFLREVGQSFLPKEICYRKDKKGFSIPEKRWLLEMGEEIFPYFDEKLSSYVDVDLMKREWMNTLKQTNSTVRIWRLLCFVIWMKVWNHPEKY